MDDVASSRPTSAAGPTEPRRRRWLRRAAAAVLVVAVAIQLVPYGWQHSNPPVRADAPWPDDASRQIARTSCYSCHSNETDWPWYSYVAPASWLVRHDVDRGRDEFNFSDWAEDGKDADDAIEMIEEGSMPPRQYTLMHPSAKLTDEEREVLIRALEQMSDDRKHDD